MIFKFEEYVSEKYDFNEVPTGNESRVDYEFKNKDGIRFVVSFIRASFFGEDSNGWVREYFIQPEGENTKEFKEINTGDSIGILKTVTDITIDFINEYNPPSIKIEHINTKKEFSKRYNDIRKGVGGSNQWLNDKPNKRALINKRFLQRDLPSNYDYKLGDYSTSYITRD